MIEAAVGRSVHIDQVNVGASGPTAVGRIRAALDPAAHGRREFGDLDVGAVGVKCAMGGFERDESLVDQCTGTCGSIGCRVGRIRQRSGVTVEEGPERGKVIRQGVRFVEGGELGVRGVHFVRREDEVGIAEKGHRRGAAIPGGVLENQVDGGGVRFGGKRKPVAGTGAEARLVENRRREVDVRKRASDNDGSGDPRGVRARLAYGAGDVAQLLLAVAPEEVRAVAHPVPRPVARHDQVRRR